jgi:ABC-type ATPase with predicted acetyltransferase domain
VMSDYTAGWTCAQCGCWVLANAVHTCSGYGTNYPIHRVSEFSQIMSKLDEIVCLLRARG